MGLADELTGLQRLRDTGAITPVEFEQQKAKLLYPAPKKSFWSTGLGTILIVVITLVAVGLVSEVLSALG